MTRCNQCNGEMPADAPACPKCGAQTSATAQAVGDLKRVVVSGFTEKLRARDAEIIKARRVKQGWRFVRYHEGGASGSFLEFDVPPGEQKAKPSKVVIAGVVVFTLVIVGNIAKGCGSKVDEPPAAPVAQAESPRPIAPAKQTPAERMRDAYFLGDALMIAAPLFADGIDVSAGTTLFTIWAIGRLRFSEIDRPQTTPALVAKDPDAERGKVTCAAGEIVQITANNTPHGKTFVGILSVKGGLVMFHAVGDSGDLVAGSNARFCGVAAGVRSYRTQAGGNNEAVELLGMFDLPTNRSEPAREYITESCSAVLARLANTELSEEQAREAWAPFAGKWTRCTATLIGESAGFVTGQNAPATKSSELVASIHDENKAVLLKWTHGNSIQWAAVEFHPKWRPRLSKLREGQKFDFIAQLGGPLMHATVRLANGELGK